MITSPSVMYLFVLFVQICVVYMICSFKRYIFLWFTVTWSPWLCKQIFWWNFVMCLKCWPVIRPTWHQRFFSSSLKNNCISSYTHTHTKKKRIGIQQSSHLLSQESQYWCLAVSFTGFSAKIFPVSLHLVRCCRTNILETWSPYTAEMNSTSN